MSIPPEVQMAWPGGFPFTLAEVMVAAGVDPGSIQSVSFFGSPWQPIADSGVVMNYAVPPMIPGAGAEIAIQVSAAEVPSGVSVTAGAADASLADGNPDDHKMMYDRIENAWRTSLQMERQMASLRKKLSSIMNSLSKMDRELHPDERLAADREDRDAWQDARRWLRDMSAKCHREIKSFDIGMTSAAGKRNSMQQTYDQIIKPRAPSNDLMKISREFEVYKKDMVNLQRNMQTALQSALQNGTQRASRVLGVISRKIRERRAKMREAIGGTNLDKSVRRKS